MNDTAFASLSTAVNGMTAAFRDLLTEMAALGDAVIGPKTPGWKAKFQVRCYDCGRFAKVLRSGDGHYHTPNGHEYDPWWTVECRRCGVGDGYIYSD